MGDRCIPVSSGVQQALLEHQTKAFGVLTHSLTTLSSPGLILKATASTVQVLQQLRALEAVSALTETFI